MYSICQQKSTIFSQTILFYDTYLFLSLIYNCLTLAKKMHIYFYYRLLDIEDNDGEL